MLNRSDSHAARRQQLSSLMDGDLPDDAAAGACALWRQDAQSRQDWHAYHLIGDVLRSDDLAAAPARDEAFLQALRLRLADEPVPLAPAATAPAEPSADGSWPQVANGASGANGANGANGALQGLVAAPARARGRRRGWMMAPVAVAAGFMAVAGVLVVTRLSAPEPAAAVLASARPVPMPASAVLVRNAQLDRYLSAHRSLANGAMPGAGAEHRVHIVFEGQ
jgi:sigma-E factor negative regulatory protein RseA